jgi:hypothetical protein
MKFIDDVCIIERDLPYPLWREQVQLALIQHYGGEANLPPDATDEDTLGDLYIDCDPPRAVDCIIAMSEPEDDIPDERTPEERAWWDELEAEIEAMGKD